MDAPLLRFDHVGRIFPGGQTALQDVSFDVPKAAVTVLLGASGAGKTTVLRLAAGLDRPTSGQVLWPNGQRPVGYVFQAPTLLPWATVAANVQLPLALNRRPDGTKVQQALAVVELGDRAQAMPHQLSGGMQMRVSIARALAADAELLLLDEPFAALDEVTRFRLQTLVRDVQQSRTMTLLTVTHSIQEACYLGDWVVVLSNHPGRVHARIAIDAPAQRSPDWRLTEAFAAQCVALSRQLEQAMAAAT